MNVMIVVTHLLGTGHLARALTLARAYITSGHNVTIASGGMPAPQLDRGDVQILQLPPLRSDGVNFTVLLDDQGAPASDAMMGDRIAALLGQLTSQAPDVLITELFPFGRRILRADTGRPQPAPPPADLCVHPRYSGTAIETQKGGSGRSFDRHLL